jgi:two-component system cell cycle response regulator
MSPAIETAQPRSTEFATIGRRSQRPWRTVAATLPRTLPTLGLMSRSESSPDPQSSMLDADLSDLAAAVILLVDDNAQNLELMQAYIESLPCRLLTASDGIEAVEILEREHVDLVLLDVMMPRMSGFEVCQKIKSSPGTRSTVVIMVTALHEFGDYERAYDSGADDFLTKPVNKLELLIRVKSQLRVRLLMKQLEELRRRLGIPEQEEPELDAAP